MTYGELPQTFEEYTIWPTSCASATTVDTIKAATAMQMDFNRMVDSAA